MRGQLAREIRSCEICRRGLVYAVVPTSGATHEPPQMYGPELNGGQMPAALAVWDRAIAEAAIEDEDYDAEDIDVDEVRAALHLQPIFRDRH